MRIKKYTQFILEKMILESNIVYSNKFKKALERMGDNKIAKQLLELEDQDLNIISNFFDIKMDNDNVVTFTSDRIAQSILNPEHENVKWIGNVGAWLKNTEANINIFDKLGYTATIGAPVYAPKHHEVGQLISTWISPKTEKTWCYVKFEGGEGVYNKEKLQSPTTEEINKRIFNTSRQDIRIGRMAQVILNSKGHTYTTAEIEQFVNLFRGVVSVMNDVFSRFEIVEGKDLLYWYNRENYEFPHQGTMGGSCMAGGHIEYLQIYVDNPETIKLLILKSDDKPDKILGRSLLWHLEDGNILMDTIYTSKDSDRNVFEEYAKAKGILRASWKETFVAMIKPKPEGYDNYPSVDTMRYWDKNTGKISNKPFAGSSPTVWDDMYLDEDVEDEDYYDDDDGYYDD